MWIFPLIMLVVMLVVVVFLLFGRRGVGPPCSPWHQPSRRGDPQDPPVEILKRRYASGEISKEEFEQMRRDLTES